jgi:hypothetical protein
MEFVVLFRRPLSGGTAVVVGILFPLPRLFYYSELFLHIPGYYGICYILILLSWNLWRRMESTWCSDRRPVHLLWTFLLIQDLSGWPVEAINKECYLLPIDTVFVGYCCGIWRCILLGYYVWVVGWPFVDVYICIAVFWYSFYWLTCSWNSHSFTF